MFRLNRPLTDGIEFGGIFYQVDMSWDNILDCYAVLGGKDNDLDKTVASLTLLVGMQAASLPIDEQVKLLQTIMDELIAPDSSGVGQAVDLHGDPMPVAGTGKKPPFSFEQDAEYIWSSFMQGYGIDLQHEYGRMDWRNFIILFRDLPDSTKIKQIIDIRQWQPSKGDSAEAKSRMRHLQDVYALDEPDEQEDT